VIHGWENGDDWGRNRKGTRGGHQKKRRNRIRGRGRKYDTNGAILKRNCAVSGVSERYGKRTEKISYSSTALLSFQDWGRGGGDAKKEGFLMGLAGRDRW